MGRTKRAAKRGAATSKSRESALERAQRAFDGKDADPFVALLHDKSERVRSEAGRALLAYLANPDPSRRWSAINIMHAWWDEADAVVPKVAFEAVFSWAARTPADLDDNDVTMYAAILLRKICRIERQRIAQLAAQLRAISPAARRIALEALNGFVEPLVPYLPDIARLVDDPDPRVAGAAVDRLRRFLASHRDSVEPALRKALASADAGVRDKAQAALSAEA